MKRKRSPSLVFTVKVEGLQDLEERKEMAKRPFSQEEYNKALDALQEEEEKKLPDHETQQHPPYPRCERDLGEEYGRAW